MVMTNSAGHVVAGTFLGFSVREIVVGLICAAVILFLLGGPILGEILLGVVGAGAQRVAPWVFVIGLVVLLIGLLAAVGLLTAIGACMLGAVLLGVVLKNYLAPARGCQDAPPCHGTWPSARRNASLTWPAPGDGSTRNS